jgi:hypothetical protein
MGTAVLIFQRHGTNSSVSVIPGARTTQQARDNATVDELSPLDVAVRTQIAELYDRRIRPSVHTRW